MDNEVLQLLDMLYSMVSDAWGVPLGNEKCIVERDKVLNIIDEIKQQLPDELAEAKRLHEQRDEYLGSAKRDADAIRQSAMEQAKALVAREEIVKIATKRSTDLIETAQRKANELVRYTNEYISANLQRAEDALRVSFDEVSATRTKFQEATMKPAMDGVETFTDSDLK